MNLREIWDFFGNVIGSHTKSPEEAASLFDVLLQSRGVLFFRFKNNKIIKNSKTFIPYNRLINHESDDDNVMIIDTHDKKGDVLETIDDWNINLTIEEFTKITRSSNALSKWMDKHKTNQAEKDYDEMDGSE